MYKKAETDLYNKISDQKNILLKKYAISDFHDSNNSDEFIAECEQVFQNIKLYIYRKYPTDTNITLMTNADKKVGFQNRILQICLLQILFSEFKNGK